MLRQPKLQKRKPEMKKLSEVFSEQHRENGRFKPTIPRMVPNKATASPRSASDSANVSLRERCWPGYKPTPGKKAYAKGSCVKESSAAAIAAATAISKKKSGNYDKEGFRKTAYKNPDHPNVKSNEQRRKEMKEDYNGGKTEQVAGSAQSTLTDRPNKEPMKTYKQKNIAELSTELLDRYKDKAAADSLKADREGNTAKADKRFSGVVKATNKQFDNFKKKGFKEETEQIDEISAQAHKEYQAKARSDVKSLAKHTGGEYGDIAKNIMQRRMKGLSTSTALQHRDTMAKVKKVNEAIKDKFDIGEYDQEGDMAKSDLRSIMANAKKLHDMIEDADNLPEWVQSKITKAEDYISTVANYMAAEMSEETKLQESGGDVVFKKGDTHIEKYGEDSFALYKDGKKAKYYTSIEAAKEAMKEEVVQEGRPSQRHPLEGHEYHKKSDDALVHIAKDAHAAAEAMKGHNTDAENKYRDQANDSATVRHFRKTSGKPDWYKKKYGLKEAFKPMDEPNYNNSIQARQKKADDNKPPFDGPYKKTQGVVTDKSGAKHGPMSRARDLARQAAKRQAGSMKEEKQKSRKAQIIKNASKGNDKFEKDPIITDTTVKTDNLQ